MVCLVYSTTDVESFDALDYWVKELNSHTNTKSIKFLIGSKIDDTENDEVSTATAKEYAKKIGAKLFLTSAKENLGINKFFTDAAIQCAQNPSLANEVNNLDASRSTSFKIRRDQDEIDMDSTYESFTQGE